MATQSALRRTEPAGHDPDRVLTSLLWLRKSAGATPKRLMQPEAADLRAVLGGVDERQDLVLDRLQSAIDSLNEPDPELLRYVFGLTGDATEQTLLRQRRQAYATKAGITVEAVADRDARAVKRLLTQLLTGWYPQSPIPVRIAESHNGVMHYLVSVTTTVRDRRLVQTRHHYRLLALFDGVDYVAWDSAANEQPIPDEGFTVDSEAVRGGFHHRFRPSTPLRRGQTYDLKFTVPGIPDDPYWLMEESLAFHEPTRFARFRVNFIGDTPAVVWRVSGLTHLARPGKPSRANVLQPDSGGSVSADFRDVYGGLFQGVAWEW